eukprot:3032984-Amphidinium_carterae.1
MQHVQANKQYANREVLAERVRLQQQRQQLQDLLAKQCSEGVEGQNHIEALLKAGRGITDSKDSMVAELREMMQASDLTVRETFAEFKRQLAQHNESSTSEICSLRKEVLKLREELTNTEQVESSKPLLIEQQISFEVQQTPAYATVATLKCSSCELVLP